MYVRCQVVPWHAVLAWSRRNKCIQDTCEAELSENWLKAFSYGPWRQSNHQHGLIKYINNQQHKKIAKMDITKSEIRDFIRIVFVCICWYIVSSSNGVLGKTILSQFPYPVTVTMVQLLSIAVWSPPLLKVSWNSNLKKIHQFLTGAWSQKVWIQQLVISHANVVPSRICKISLLCPGTCFCLESACALCPHS